MANEGHLEILEQGVEVWNRWREENPDVQPDLVMADLSRADLSRADLSSTDLRRADLRRADLSRADLSRADLSETHLHGANLSGANLHKASIDKTDLREANLCKADLSEAHLGHANLSQADLKSANLSHADLHGANLDKANLSKANLSNADFSWSRLRGAKLVGSDLSRADFRGAHLQETNLCGANLRTADLRSARFSGADLREGDLFKVNLSGANLSSANLSKANLSEADLSDADLSGADLSEADLRNVMFAEANGRTANLSHAKLGGAKFTKPDESKATRGFLELAATHGLQLADFGDQSFLPKYLSAAFTYAHRPCLEERLRFPKFVAETVANIKLLRQLYEDQSEPPRELVKFVQTITAELIKYLKDHPRELYNLRPRQFEELIFEILSSYPAWKVVLTPETKDGGYDLFAISTDAPGVKTSWLIECKKYSERNKVGVDIVRALYGLKSDLKVANGLLATTSYFTKGVKDFKASRYDIELRDYDGILDWLNEYKPNPGGKLYIKDNKLRLPGEK